MKCRSLRGRHRWFQSQQPRLDLITPAVTPMQYANILHMLMYTMPTHQLRGIIEGAPMICQVSYIVLSLILLTMRCCRWQKTMLTSPTSHLLPCTATSIFFTAHSFEEDRPTIQVVNTVTVQLVQAAARSCEHDDRLYGYHGSENVFIT